MTTTTTTASTDNVRSLIAAELDDLVAIRRDLHVHPELGYEEHRTSEQVRKELTDAGVEFIGGLGGGTGVLAHIPGKSSQVIGLRADMDALPITEETGLPYASQTDGVMHACGHDGHTTMLIGTMRVLAKMSKDSELPNPVTFLFQPAEEGLGGGEKMVQDGCLDGSVIGSPISMMFGQHGWPQLPFGVVGTRPGPFLAAADTFIIEVTGVGGHAAAPHLGRDPIVAGSAIVNALQTIASRNVDPLESVVLSVTQFHGGTTHNIIPETITITGTVRTLNDEIQNLTKKRMEEITTHIAAGYGCKANFTYKYGYPVTLNNVDAVDCFEKTAKATLGEDRFQHMPHPVMGAEDFSYYCKEVPSCFFALGLQPEGEYPIPQLHHPKFNFNDEAIAIGVEIFCRLALNNY